MVYVGISFKFLWCEPSTWDDPVELCIFEVLYTTFCLVQPVAVESCLVIASFVVPGVLENVVETVSFVLAFCGMSLIVKTQYVDLFKSSVQGQPQCCWST